MAPSFHGVSMAVVGRYTKLIIPRTGFGRCQCIMASLFAGWVATWRIIVLIMMRSDWKYAEEETEEKDVE